MAQNQTKCTCGGNFTRNVRLVLRPGDIIISCTNLGSYPVGLGWKINDDEHRLISESEFPGSSKRKITITCLGCGDSIKIDSISKTELGGHMVSPDKIGYYRVDPPKR